jgi:ribosomal protein S18 acetylase RimI-like enzyme
MTDNSPRKVSVHENGVRRACACDLPALTELADRVFRSDQPPGTAMIMEFPLLFKKSNAHNLYFIEDAGRPVSLAGMRPGKLQFRGATLSIASMGSVCTLPEYRGRHLASTLVEAILRDFRSQVSLIFISGDRSIYRRHGFVRFGISEQYRMDCELNDAANTEQRSVCPYDVRGLDDSYDSRELCAIYADEPSGFMRTPEDMSSAIQSEIFRQRSLVRESSVLYGAYLGQRLAAYAVVSPSSAASRVLKVIEWAGDRLALAPVLRLACREHQLPYAQWYASPSDRTMRTLARAWGATEVTVPNQGTVRVLNVERLLQEAGGWIAGQTGAFLVLETVDAHSWRPTWTLEKGQMQAGAGTPPFHRSMMASGDPVIRGYDTLSQWLFGTQGLALPLPRTDDLNYI